METPALYGWFHILFLALVIVATFAAIRIFKNKDERSVSRMVTVVWIVLVVLELYKQINYTFSYEGGITSDYQWYAFPYQFCSTPLYVLPFIAFCRDGKLRDTAIAFMASFSLFAGLAVMLYPGDVFIETIGINIQTMVHHGSQVVLGIFFGVRYRERLNKLFFARGIIMYACVLAIALIMNVVVYHAFAANAIDETFNMFYISPYFDCTLPILSMIYPAVPYPVFLAIYIVGFSIAALAVISIVYGITKGVLKIYARSRKSA